MQAPRLSDCSFKNKIISSNGVRVNLEMDASEFIPMVGRLGLFVEEMQSTQSE